MPVVATISLHGSASTWLFNVAREALIAAFGADKVTALYTDTADRIPVGATNGERRLIIKSHHGSPGLDTWLENEAATILLSVRDPRDAAISMAQRFKSPLNAAVHWLRTDCARMQRLVAKGHPVFRYEDGFFNDPEAAARVASLLDLTLDEGTIASISDRYSTDAMRTFTRYIEALSPDRLVRSGNLVFDDVTQIHQTHIGDGRVGKWRELPEPVKAELTRQFTPYLEAFGYPA